MSGKRALQPGLVYVVLDDVPIGMGICRQDGKIDFKLPDVPKGELDGSKIRFLQGDEHDWDEFCQRYDQDAWECELCGGDGVREYNDAPDEWGEDCPSALNHLIPCRGCRAMTLARHEAFAKYLLAKAQRGVHHNVSGS